MPYARKTRTPSKSFKKRSYTRKPSAKSMYSIAKRVMRTNTETKSRIQSFTPNPVTMYHNVPKLIASQLLVTSQGIDSGATSGNRIGNSIQPVGINSIFNVVRTRLLLGLICLTETSGSKCGFYAHTILT